MSMPEAKPSFDLDRIMRAVRMRKPLRADPAARAVVLDACLSLIAEGLFPGCSKLARRTGIGPTTVVQVRDELVRRGDLSIPHGLRSQTEEGQRRAIDALRRSRDASHRAARAAAALARRARGAPADEAEDHAAIPVDRTAVERRYGVVRIEKGRVRTLEVLNASDAALILPRSGREIRRMVYRELVGVIESRRSDEWGC